ncbi:DUF6220 domain-containing protein [Alkalihalobacillus sp. AL-G]|uniref:DUF6220 domain-containing protein n=1 Tax=Alkalihalobacillus sp. AL-G TaxID=2926399 RepID=UPI00272C7048|nr:DUF6220 domain-containing protein [Alkalihalobacillus sp. AL-G]WLD94642.1 DUF6220 domain-containing protein [Alkalihalobacillus sp. AL-G]
MDTENHSNNRVQVSRIAFLVSACAFTVCVVIQTFLAGMAIFDNPSHWTHHTTFVVWFQLIPIVMLILSFTGNLPKPIRWQSVGLFVLIVPLQYISIHIPGLGAIHPVIALILFALSFNVIRKTGMFSQERER